MLSHRNDGCRRVSALNDNGCLSGAWHEASPAAGVLSVASQGSASINLTYVAAGVLLISGATKGPPTNRKVA